MVRQGAATDARPATHDDVYRVLSLVSDPEMPGVSLVDLGMVETVSVTADGIVVTLMPTFVGCPALDIMRENALARLTAAFSDRAGAVRVTYTNRTGWTSDRIRPTCHPALRSRGIAPPPPSDTLPHCPWCGSAEVVSEGLFGPAACRSVYYCRACKNPFEGLKRLT